MTTMETLIEAGTRAATDAIGDVDEIAIAIIVEAAITAVLPLVAAETARADEAERQRDSFVESSGKMAVRAEWLEDRLERCEAAETKGPLLRP